jgi:hypothetical protein
MAGGVGLPDHGLPMTDVLILLALLVWAGAFVYLAGVIWWE